jgi:hypothetical protein
MKHPLFTALVLLTAGAASAQVLPVQSHPKVLPAVHHGATVARLRDILPNVALRLPQIGEVRRIVPRPNAPEIEDSVLQSTEYDAGPSNIPRFVQQFDGLGQGFTGPNGLFHVIFDPPDTNIAVGHTQIVEMVNTAVAVFDKATHQWISGPTDLHDVWSQDFPDCRLDDGDPIVLYDPGADRWILSQLGGRNFGDECIAVSETSDATGQYYLYEFKVAPSTDYPKISVWPDAYYLTTNEYGKRFNYLGAGLCALQRSAMLVGGDAISICFNTSTDYDTVLSAHMEGATPPPPGAPKLHVRGGQ